MFNSFSPAGKVEARILIKKYCEDAKLFSPIEITKGLEGLLIPDVVEIVWCIL